MLSKVLSACLICVCASPNVALAGSVSTSDVKGAAVTFISQRGDGNFYIGLSKSLSTDCSEKNGIVVKENHPVREQVLEIARMALSTGKTVNVRVIGCDTDPSASGYNIFNRSNRSYFLLNR